MTRYLFVAIAVELSSGPLNWKGVFWDDSPRMIRTLQTYRTLPALLATLMVLSVGLPVLCQVCMPAAAERTAMHASHESGHDAPVHCLHGHADASDGVESTHSAQSCDDAACTMVAEDPEPAVQTERMVLAVHDGAGLMPRAVTLLDDVPSPRALTRSSGYVDHHSRIPIRLQTASFLL